MKGRNLLMIPGPIEFTPEVMASMAQPTTSHVAPDFIECFGESLKMMREVFLAPSAQPFILAGSGTLGMDAAVANLVEPGDRVLTVNSGYFSDRMGEIARRYGAEVENLSAPVGDIPGPDQVREALEGEEFRVVTITHVDTSTGVMADVEGIAAVAKEAGALVIVDGVCGTAGAECRTEEWGVDVHLTASQKAIGVPPGLALLTVSPEAMERFRSRKTPVASYYSDFGKWLPIMEAYENRGPAYFGTPAVNLVAALNTSLKQVLAEGMQERFARHRRLASAFRSGVAALGLDLVAVREELAAPTLSAVYYPDGVGSELVGEILSEGIITAGGLHPDIKEKYFRVGHMGAANPSDIVATLGAIERGLSSLGYRFEKGAALAAAQEVFCRG
ncbi:MAG: alanine--glyoxylate aminotransferase family protein [Bacillota bacterium]